MGSPDATLGLLDATLGFPDAKIGFPDATFGFPDATLGFPDAALGFRGVKKSNTEPGEGCGAAVEVAHPGSAFDYGGS